MNIKEYTKNNNLELTEQQIKEVDGLTKQVDGLMQQVEDAFEREGDRLPTLGFGIPNLLKSGKVGYFPEQFLVELGLQGKTASEIARYFISTGMDIDGDIITRTYSNTRYFVDFRNNVFIKYYAELEDQNNEIEFIHERLSRIMRNTVYGVDGDKFGERGIMNGTE